MRFFLFLSLLFVTTLATAQNKWMLKKNTNGIKVYYRTAADSDVKELKIVTSVATNAEAAAAVLTDVLAHPRWIYSCVETKILKKVNENELYFQDRLDFPWPMSDRDIIGHFTIKKDPATGTITSVNNAAPTYLPEEKDYVRIKQSKATWILEPQGENQTKMTYFLKSNPGGALPAWVVNLAMDRGPVQSVMKFKEMAMRK